MKLLPLISFKMQKEMFSTEILGMPLSERWWFVSGDAVLRTPDGEKSQNLSMIAYRNQGSWFLVPLQLDDYWEKIHPEPDLLTVDRASEITIHNSKDCPLEIANLHALVNKDYHSIRNLTFVLQNHTDKKVKGYTLRLYARGGDQIYSAPYEIEPGSERAEKMDSTRYSSLCEGIVQDNLIVDDVQFSDGTSWDRHSPRRNSRTPLR